MRDALGHQQHRRPQIISSAHMKTNIKNEEIFGIAPVLLCLSPASAGTSSTWRRSTRHPDGTPVAVSDPNMDFKPRGVRIWFRTENDPRLRSLTYIEQYRC
ncbi:MAG: hypothetical protein U1F27_10660 [Turneriella sp.]